MSYRDRQGHCPNGHFDLKEAVSAMGVARLFAVALSIGVSGLLLGPTGGEPNRFMSRVVDSRRHGGVRRSLTSKVRGLAT
jgi:hypothetical protein